MSPGIPEARRARISIATYARDSMTKLEDVARDSMIDSILAEKPDGGS